MQLIQSQQLTINTLELRAMVNDARAGFGESQVRNDHFLARVEDELGEEIIGVEKFCIPHHGNLVDAYTLTLEQAMLVGMRESKGVRRQVLEQLKNLQAQAAAPQFNIPTTLSGALRLAAEQAETIEAQQLLIEKQKPSVEFVESYVEAEGLMGFRQVAKLLGANERKFRQMLLDQGVMYYLAGVLTPMAQHIKAGRFEVKTGEADNGHAYTSAKFTPKGVEYVSRLWRAEQ